MVADALTGDLAPLVLQRLASDGTTVIDSAAGLSLRWENATGTALDQERVRVASGGCTRGLRCGRQLPAAGHGHHGRGLALQQLGDAGHGAAAPERQRRGGDGPRLVLGRGRSAARGAAVLPGAPRHPHPRYADGARRLRSRAAPSRSPTPARTAAISGKAVAVEPATGFTFDTALVGRPR